MTEDTNTTASAPPDAAVNEAEAAKRGKGRPTIAELDARAAVLAEKEAALDLRAREAELKLAEANAAMRELDLERVEAQIASTASAPARSGTLRNESARSATVTEPLRRRRFHGGEMPSEFHIPEEQIPTGTSYQWNNYTVFGMQNPAYDSHMLMQGWRPVDASRHPHLVPEGYKGPLIVKGQVLMERPMELTREALQEDYERAVGEVRRKEEQLYGTPAGTMPRARANGSSDFIQVNREVVPGDVTPRQYQYEGAGLPVE